MDNLRKYGHKPFNIAVIHGGPGAPGSMAPLATELSKKFGVLEPLQTKDSIDCQIHELKEILEDNTNEPVILIGHSWGAWLAYMFAARHPKMVRKIILVGCGSFEEKYLSEMNNSRQNRLTEDENNKVKELMELLNDPNNINRKKVLSEFGKLMSKADSYAPIELQNNILDFNPEIFQNCMKEINYLRKSNQLLNMGIKIKCPVIAIHGEYDSHSFKGVKEPLSKVLKEFQFFLLEKCGHDPWNEVYAKDRFYEIIYEELSK